MAYTAPVRAALRRTWVLVALAGAACTPRTGPDPGTPAAPAATVAPNALPEGEVDSGPPETITGPDMITIPAGPFTRGALGGRADEQPVRVLELPEFSIDRTEVDVGSYTACVRAGACPAAGAGPGCNAAKPDRDRFPINCISWAQATAFCKFAGKRLPTEAEWEKAARSGTSRLYVWGDAWPPPRDAGNFSDRSAQRARPYWQAIDGYDDGAANTVVVDARVVATVQGGLHFGGNVAEWVADWYEAKAYEGGVEGPKRGKTRVLRGGSFGHASGEDLRVTRRLFYDPARSSLHFGVRCAK